MNERNNGKSDIEKEVLEFWKENKIFEKSVEESGKNGDFVFYDGPPYATGEPHYGHLLPGTVKDVFPRYKTMKGFRVERRWGWDCHGLPIENLVEKKLGINSKQEIEEYGVDKFNELARESVLQYEDVWKKVVPRTGRWVDMDNAYKTMEPWYTESVWWSFAKLNEKGLVYEGYKIMYHCPRCETALANHEVNQGYTNIKDITVTAKFKLIGEDNTYVLAWTTTPWTLPGNTALAVGETMEYAYVQYKDGGIYIVSAERIKEIFNDGEYEIVKKVSGRELVGKEYEPVFDLRDKIELQNRENGWKIYPGDFVTDDEGTGIVHIAPAFGQEDLELAKRYSVPVIIHVTPDGHFTKEVGIPEVKVKTKDDNMSADIEILKKLAGEDKIFEKHKHEHSYPLCWRCDTPLINYPSRGWFVAVTKIRDKIIEENSKVRWMPEHIKDGRFGKWLENVVDWNVSRSRYWGAVLPVWKNKQTGEKVFVDSFATLAKHVKKSGNTYKLLRHGESLSNVSGTCDSSGDPSNSLTEKGKEQVRFVAEELSANGVDMIIYSPLLRTKQTAEIIKEVLGLGDENMVADERIREIDCGEWSGKSVEEAFGSGDIESEESVDSRVAEFIFDIDKKYSDKTILIVTHGGIIKSFDRISKKAALWGFGNPEDNMIDDTPRNAKIYDYDFVRFPHNRKGEFDVHRPYIDELEMVDEDGQELVIDGSVFDVWYESGSMPFASLHYPFENMEAFEKRRFPADLIAEGIDQTRGWFYTLLVLSSALFESSPYKNVVTTGIVLAEDGKKMSKRLKNYPPLDYMLESYGADSLRLFMLGSSGVKGREVLFSEKEVKSISSKTIGRLYNVMTLYKMYSDGNKYSEPKVVDVLDEWILEKLKITEKGVAQNLENLELAKAVKLIHDFVEDFSGWYARRKRDKFKSENEMEKVGSLSCTHYVLKNFAKILAPFAPFSAEHVWRNIRSDEDEESVHLSAWPENIIGGSGGIVEEMSVVREVISEALNIRKREGLRIRQPLSEIRIKKEIPKKYHFLIAEEVNVLSVIDGDSSLSEEVWLNIEISEALKSMWYARELVRFLQSERKKMGLVHTDRINVDVCTDTDMAVMLKRNADYVRKIAGVENLNFIEVGAGEKLDIDGKEILINIERISR